ncbi:MAG: 50S ribosomal protein L3 [SAR324 cluster bacterium]|nr:50S ribosomal protein L3 [SAR324 cluster bacterium]
MIKGLLGKKVGMTRIFTNEGESIPVTLVEVPPAVLVQKKNLDKDGYEALQVGSVAIEKKKLAKSTKPYLGHFKDQPPTKYLKEFPADDIDALEVGKIFDVSIFKSGDLVDVSGISKGRGFAGVVKRYKFAGGPASHGHRFHRTTGSIGQRKFPGRVFKNKRMPGHMGAVKVTLQNLKIAEVDLEKNLILIHGAVPGANGKLLTISKAIKVKIKAKN